MRPETRYARSGDVFIGYQVFGEGPFDLVVVPGALSNIEYGWEFAGWRDFYGTLASFARVLLFDKRGTGISDPVQGAPSVEERMDDVRAVMDAAGSHRAALMGSADGGAIVVLFAATYPERTAALVLNAPVVRGSWAPDFPWGVGPDESDIADAIRDLNRRRVPAVLDSEGTPLRLGVEAEPFLVTPNQREAEGLVGQEFRDDEDYLMAVDRVADMGARNVLITSETRSFALFREERKRQRFRAVAPEVEPVSAVGSGDVLLAAFLAARLADKSLEESMRHAVAAGAASTLEVGAGRFEPRDATRLQQSVDVRELEPVGT